MQLSRGQKPIVVVGSINADLVAQVERIPRAGETVLGSKFKIHPGGKGGNQAVAVGRLGYPVAMVGKLGTDPFGQMLRSSLSEAGVEVSAVTTADEASGVALIEVSAKAENSIVVAPGANYLVTPEDINANIELLRSAGVVLVQLEIPQETVTYLLAVCKREGIAVILDPAPARELPAELFEAVTWFTPNETEAAFYTGLPNASARQQRDALFARGVEGVILKLGAKGVYLATRAGLEAEVPAFAVKAVDTTAAGDAFNGAFATALMMGKDAVESARFAVAAAAVSVTRPGAQPSLASLPETEKMLGVVAKISGG
jgi:ribokinase